MNGRSKRVNTGEKKVEKEGKKYIRNIGRGGERRQMKKGMKKRAKRGSSACREARERQRGNRCGKSNTEERKETGKAQR